MKIKILLKNLRTLIYGLIIDIVMMILIRRNEFAKTRSRRLTQGNAELVLNDEELSDVIARKLILQFQNDDALFLGKISTQDLHDEFSDIRKFTGPKATIIESKLKAEESGVTAKFIDTTLTELDQVIPGTTVDVLYIKEQEIAAKASEAATKKHFINRKPSKLPMMLWLQ